MIRYTISKQELEKRIESSKPGWLARAKAKSAEFEAAGKYVKGPDIWSEVKSVYMELQGKSKCIFCERKLESVEFGKVEQDVEHFRPKGNVKEWKLPSHLKNEGIVLTKPVQGKGYYKLAYHVFNYAASCKPCNSILKREYFPIAGTYQMDLDNPENGLQEKPYLLYPISDFDDDPEALIEFVGVVPTPVKLNGFERKRALVIIDFFKLADEKKRSNLFEDRARVIVSLYQLLKVNDPRAFTLPNSLPHLNCAHSFIRLFQSNRAEADQVFESAQKLVFSIS